MALGLWSERSQTSLKLRPCNEMVKLNGVSVRRDIAEWIEQVDHEEHILTAFPRPTEGDKWR